MLAHGPFWPLALIHSDPLSSETIGLLCLRLARRDDDGVVAKRASKVTAKSSYNSVDISLPVKLRNCGSNTYCT